MKCFEAEKWILLSDSGELNAQRGKMLRAHLETCESCRKFENMLSTVKPACKIYEAPPARVVYNVLREARTRIETKTLQIIYWKPALALAATVAIALGLFFNLTGPGSSSELAFTENDILELDAQIVGVMEDGLSEDNLAFNFLMTYEGT